MRRESERLAADLGKAKKVIRGPGNAVGAVGGTRHRQRGPHEQRRAEMIDEAIDELTVGVARSYESTARASAVQPSTGESGVADSRMTATWSAPAV